MSPKSEFLNKLLPPFCCTSSSGKHCLEPHSSGPNLGIIIISIGVTVWRGTVRNAFHWATTGWHCVSIYPLPQKDVFQP